MEKTKIIIKQIVELASYNVTNEGSPFAAAIVKDFEIICVGVNTVTKDNDPTAHAEINAIRNACNLLNIFNLSEYNLYTSCEPCPMCLGAIYWAKINNVYFAATRSDADNYGFSDKFIYDELNKSYMMRQIKTVPVKILDRLLPFEQWLNKNNKIKY